MEDDQACIIAGGQVLRGSFPLGYTKEVFDAEAIAALLGLKAAIKHVGPHAASNIWICLDNLEVRSISYPQPQARHRKSSRTSVQSLPPGFPAKHDHSLRMSQSGSAGSLDIQTFLATKQQTRPLRRARTKPWRLFMVSFLKPRAYPLAAFVPLGNW